LMMWNGRQTANKVELTTTPMFQSNALWAVVSSLFFLVVPSILGQTRPPEGVTIPCATAELKQGLVVESLTKNSEGEKAGILEGDVIRSWTRVDVKGKIESPFDLSEIETEQEPRGRVTLEGTRGELKQAWVMGPNRWDIQTRPSLPPSLLVIYRDGRDLAKAGKLDEAAERWRVAAAEGRKLQCSWLSPWLLFQAAEVLANARHWKVSDSFYQEATREAAGASSETKAQLLQALAQAFEQQSDWTNSEKYNLEALKEIQRSAPEGLTAAAILNRLGGVADRRGDLSKAEVLFRQALTINKKLAPGSLAVALSLHSLGNVLCDRGDLDKAEEYYHQALEIRERFAPGSLDVTADLNGLGNVAYGRGDLDNAEKYYSQASEMREKLAPGGLDVAMSLNNLGNVAEERGDLAKAEEFHRQALEIRERLAPGSLYVAASLNNLGEVENDRWNLAKAEEYHRHALEIHQRLAPGSLAVATSLNNLGNVADERGDLVGAEKYYRAGLEIEEKLAPGSLGVAMGLNNIGNVAEERGDLAKAEEYHRHALEIQKRIAPDSLDMAASLGGLGSDAKDRGDLGKADEYIRQALAIYEKLAPSGLDVAMSLNNLGEVARDRGELAKAEEYCRLALEIRKKLAPESADYADSLAALGGIMRDKQLTEEAARLFGLAIDVLERQVALLGGSSAIRAGFRAKYADYYSAYSELLVTQQHPEVAFQVIERSRARILLETLAEAHVDIRQGADPLLLERERNLQVMLAAKSNRRINLREGDHSEVEITAVSKEIDDLLSQYQEVEGQIRTSNPNYAALTQPQPVSTKEIQQQLLNADTVLLEYSLGEKRSLVFVLTPTSLDSYELPKRSQIEDTAHVVYDLLTSRNRWIDGETTSQRQERVAKGEAEYQKAVAALSQMVLGPVAARLEGKRLLIVADGALQYVPFAILPVVHGNVPGPAVPLVAENEIVNLPSASVLGLLRRQANGRSAALKEVAVLADPVFDKVDPRVGKATQNKQVTPSASEKQIPSFPEQLTRSLGDVGLGTRQAGVALPRLAFSRQEADAIMAMTNAGKGMEALDFQANREAAQSKDLGQYRIVHFATHGLLDNQHPELSGLVLSLVDQQGNSQDGFLDLEDVYNLTLPADLVVLSACETGLGKQIAGEGLVGLTRGFMYAGASRVVASLWKVDDVATAELMERFYRGMLKEGLRPAAALRQAQIEMQAQKRWADPYYWAAFTIQGEWK
jgi:CHAT domain-containing protein/tetratricopeptide (TPR) repeat protein